MNRNRRLPEQKWVVRGMVVIVLLLGIGALGYVFRGHVLSGLDLVAEATGGRGIALGVIVVSLIALACAFLWMLFPLILYLGLRDLRHRTTELNETIKGCVGHLAAVKARDGLAQPERSFEEQNDGLAQPEAAPKEH
jgi:hypothetical protein